MNAYIFESFEAAPPVTFATRNCDSSCTQTDILCIANASQTILSRQKKEPWAQHTVKPVFLELALNFATLAKSQK